jgi:flagellar motor switch protein FliM
VEPATELGVTPDAASSATPTPAAGPAPRERVVVPYDFRRPSKLSREHVRLLQIAYESFARRLGTVLTSSLRQVCVVGIRDITQENYEEYVVSLETQTLVVPLNFPSLGSMGVLEFSLETALAAVDHMLGGPGGEQPARTLTDIEGNLLSGLIEQIVGALTYSMESICPLTASIGMIEYNPQFVQAAAATEPVVVGRFDMTVGTVNCTLTLCLQLASLLPKLIAHRQREEDETSRLVQSEAAKRARERLGEVPVDVTIRFSSVELSSTRILSLSEGEILHLPHRVGVSLDVQAGGITFAKAIAGRSGNQLAALIVQTQGEHS